MWNNPTVKYPILSGIVTAIITLVTIVVIGKIFGISVVDNKKLIVSLVSIPVGMFLSNFYIASSTEVRLPFYKYVSANFFFTIICCLCGAILLYLYLEIVDTSLISAYIQETKHQLLANKQAYLTDGISLEIFTEQLNNLDRTTAYTIAQDDAIKKLFIAVFSSLLASFYFSKIFIPVAKHGK
jgi:hypothetical protein